MHRVRQPRRLSTPRRRADLNPLGCERGHGRVARAKQDGRQTGLRGHFGQPFERLPGIERHKHRAAAGPRRAWRPRRRHRAETPGPPRAPGPTPRAASIAETRAARRASSAKLVRWSPSSTATSSGRSRATASKRAQGEPSGSGTTGPVHHASAASLSARPGRSETLKGASGGRASRSGGPHTPAPSLARSRADRGWRAYSICPASPPSRSSR